MNLYFSLLPQKVVFVLLFLLFQINTNSWSQTGDARVVQVGMVAPNVLGITIEDGLIIPAKQRPITLSSSNTIGKWGEVIRNGKNIGLIVGKNKDIIFGFDEVKGRRFDVSKAKNKENYSIQSKVDQNYKVAQKPLQVSRKSKMLGMARVDTGYNAVTRHKLYLQLPFPLQQGKTYQIKLPDQSMPLYSFKYEAVNTVSEAIHVNHLGFAPADKLKIAFLSCWRGDGGGQKYPTGMTFSIVDLSTKKSAFNGKITLNKAASDAEVDGKNHNLADVHQMDFSALTKPGKYKVVVDNLGCSLPFEISPTVYEQAMLTSSKGFYVQRNGIEIGPPYSKFKRPRPMHPDDVPVYQNIAPNHPSAMDDLLPHANASLKKEGWFKDGFVTDSIVKNGWGGYMDAGDWDRMTDHLVSSRSMLELAELFPNYFNQISFNIPESKNNIPDIVDEALFGLDIYFRLQLPDGGIRGGIESSEHPKHGEGSWQESQTLAVFAPDCYSSYEYAATAAKAARWLRKNNFAEKANLYQQSALRAMQWAEKKYLAHKDPHLVMATTYGGKQHLADSRNLAAAELFALTGEKKWNDIFIETTIYKTPMPRIYEWEKYAQKEAPFTYALTQHQGKDKKIADNCIASLKTESDSIIKIMANNAFRWAKFPTYPIVFGNGWIPSHGETLLRTFWITRDDNYLKNAVGVVQLCLGANPGNITYTSGLGHDFPRQMLHSDSKASAQPLPEGLSVLGPIDIKNNYQDWWCLPILQKYIYPQWEKWPIIEAYFDVGDMHPIMCEYTLTSNSSTFYNWAFLSAINKR